MGRAREMPSWRYGCRTFWGRKTLKFVVTVVLRALGQALWTTLLLAVMIAGGIAPLAIAAAVRYAATGTVSESFTDNPLLALWECLVIFGFILAIVFVYKLIRCAMEESHRRKARRALAALEGFPNPIEAPFSPQKKRKEFVAEKARETLRDFLGALVAGIVILAFIFFVNMAETIMEMGLESATIAWSNTFGNNPAVSIVGAVIIIALAVALIIAVAWLVRTARARLKAKESNKKKDL